VWQRESQLRADAQTLANAVVKELGF
jgi:hypothetical protein